ncbi:hypothetical protein ACSBR2_021877 [Camellia fascicularis]
MEDGGWIPVVRQRGRQGRQRNEGCANVFTIFVDNIPNSVNPKGLHNLFAKFGVVRDVFIPNKRRRITNTRFGFVRFDCKVAASVAVQKGTGLWMDDKAIVVKHAAFGKETRGEKRLTGLVRPQGRNQNGQRGVDRRWIEVSTDHRSYAEAVIGKTRGGRDNITVKADEIGNGWLYESVVVRLKEDYANINLKKEIEAIGVEDVLVRESGGRDVVFTFKSVEEMSCKLKPIKDLIMDWCEVISEGKSGMVLEQERNVWLSCYGIPLNLWNSTNVKRIGGLWGKFICFEGDINQPRSFVCAKLKISTNCMEPINKKNQELEELGSSNAIDEYGMKRGNNAEDRDDDLESDSDHDLALLDDVAIDIKAPGERKSEEVEQEVCCKSDTVVAESRSGAGMVVGMGNHNIGLSTDAEACRLMMGMGKHNIGSALGNWKSQSKDDHVPTAGYIRSLGGESPSRPGIDLEVVLGHNQGPGPGTKLRQAQQCNNGLKGQASSSKEGTGEAGLVVQNSSVSDGKVVEPNNRPVIAKKGKKKVSYKKQNGNQLFKKGPLSLLRAYGQRGASTSRSVLNLSLSTPVENGLDKGRCVLNEAQATLKMGEVLGVQFNGKEDEVLKKIVGLELNDQGRI